MFGQRIYFLAKCIDCRSSGNVFSHVEQPGGIKKPSTVAVFCGYQHAVAYRGGFGVLTPPRNSEGPPKNRAKLNPIVKTVKKKILNLGRQHPKMFRKK